MKLALLVLLAQGALSAIDEAPPTLARAVPAGEILTESDLTGTPASKAAAVGLAARRYLLKGAVLRAADLRAPVVVARNQPVRLVFKRGSVTISADGRAFSDAALGETVRVMSLSSKSAVVGVATGEGTVEVR